ncbi:unnamed protein product [Macrosiphum euphorbiae]|uniref:Uncharacterized protein n=1 Tax=Macrosiphum euphorbiae TaxID=13131 RepID=A0AAV0Y7Y5_9HEMI|nr:unnamed protein product [Macrosiphum euphorbiae]
MHAAFLCLAILASAPSAIANDRLSSIGGPIFRTQPAPSRSNVQIKVTETVLVPQPALCQTDDQTMTTKTADSDPITNPPQQQLHSTQSLDYQTKPNLLTRPPILNETAADTDSYAHYCDQDDEYVEDDYIQFFCCIPIILLIMLVLLGHLNLHYFCTSRMKKDSMESVSSRTTNS